MSNEGRYRQRLSTFAANWRALALRGLVALLFGLVVLFWPGLVFAVLALLFGIYAVVDGAITFVPALRSSERGARRWLPLTEGAVGIIAGLIALLLSGMTANGLVYVIVGWALATGMQYYCVPRWKMDGCWPEAVPCRFSLAYSLRSWPGPTCHFLYRLSVPSLW
jgi:uncharacterized membrane protein HdeD (DUF308 family)